MISSGCENVSPTLKRQLCITCYKKYIIRHSALKTIFLGKSSNR